MTIIGGLFPSFDNQFRFLKCVPMHLLAKLEKQFHNCNFSGVWKYFASVRFLFEGYNVEVYMPVCYDFTINEAKYPKRQNG